MQKPDQEGDGGATKRDLVGGAFSKHWRYPGAARLKRRRKCPARAARFDPLVTQALSTGHSRSHTPSVHAAIDNCQRVLSSSLPYHVEADSFDVTDSRSSETAIGVVIRIC